MNSNKLWGTSGLKYYVRERDPSLSHPPSSPPSICKKYYPKHLRQLRMKSYRDAPPQTISGKHTGNVCSWLRIYRWMDRSIDTDR